ncbi:MAG: tRNA-dihydrouridine synthase [Patescibacteria group bacterium]
MVFKGFWEKLEKPVIGLAPMDGVTDAAFRYMICKYSKPSVVITEFTNVEGIARGNVRGMVSFLYNEIERPVVAQIFGVEVESYYKCAVMLAAMGFDGIDINMGCPVTKVAAKGSGAALIKTPELAKELIKVTKKGVEDWVNGITLEKAGVHPDIILEVEKMNLAHSARIERKMIPVSVKTRIGYDEIVAEEWMKHLLEAEPANITLHGRTLRQLYMGKANWEAIAQACQVVKSSGLGVSFLGNGDVQTIAEAREKVEQYGVDGVLVGRAVMGNPWFFAGREPTPREGLEAAVEHSRYFSELGHMPFLNIRKHLGWYCKGFDGAKELRMKLMQVNSDKEVEHLIGEINV